MNHCLLLRRVIFLCLPLVAGFGLAGCASKAKKEAAFYQRNAAVRAQEEALIAQLNQTPSVFLRGAIQRPMVPWRENLTLAEVLLDSGYNSTLSPRVIRVTRQGRSYDINVRALLRGQDNPVMEPGDMVEVYR